MSLTIEEVEHIAQLARLELTAEEKERFRQQLSDILDYAARLQQVELPAAPSESGAEPTAAPLRADEPRPGLSPADLLRNAPQVEAGQFRVPPVME